jgi:hypothetical protein
MGQFLLRIRGRARPERRGQAGALAADAAESAVHGAMSLRRCTVRQLAGPASPKESTMRTLVCALALLCLAASGAVAQESKESKDSDPGRVTPAGATKDERSAAAIGPGVTGCWATGVTDPWLVWLVQRGNKVWGYYVPNRPSRKGRLQGTLKGSRLEYDWWESQENGTGYFDLADDGQSMHGKWHYDFTKGWGGKWGLTRRVGTPEAHRELKPVESAVDNLRATAGALAEGFVVYEFKADPRSLIHDHNACCATHTKQLRTAIPAVAEALANYVRAAEKVDGYAPKIAGRLAGKLGQLKLALDAHAQAKYLPAANRAMEQVKRAVYELDNSFVWLEASLAIEVACRRLRLHLAAPEAMQDQAEFQRALEVVKRTAATLQAHYRASEDPVGVGLAGQMMQMAVELDEAVVAGLEAGGELRAAALHKVKVGYPALLAKKREIDACCQ